MADFLSEAQHLASKTKSTRVIRLFPDSDMRCSHEGLAAVAKKNDIDPLTLHPGEFLVFINSRQTMFKIYAPGNCIAFVKHPEGHRLDLSVVRYIPRFFNGTEFNLDAATRKMIGEKLNRAAS